MSFCLIQEKDSLVVKRKIELEGQLARVRGFIKGQFLQIHCCEKQIFDFQRAVQTEFHKHAVALKLQQDLYTLHEQISAELSQLDSPDNVLSAQDTVAT
jgi:hypothetical protein